MIALVELVVYKMGDLPLKFFGGIVVLQFHNVLQRTVITLTLSLGHRVVGRATLMLDVFALQVILQVMGQAA
jgi:hypothetical protein